MLTLLLLKEETELILASLRKLPMEISEDLVMKIRGQAIPQLQQQQEAAAEVEAAESTEEAKAE
jgi:hypothetical protein